MEFHVWGKLDENGRIQTVQSSCSHGNSFNPTPDQSVGEAWMSGSGEKYVPYSTKKELTCKLDTKIDEMSLIMVQMGELTKRLKLQEKLIAEYEKKAERQNAELIKLRQENDQLRSMVFKRKRNSSSFSSFDESSLTAPKAVDDPMDSSDIEGNILPLDESCLCPLGEVGMSTTIGEVSSRQEERLPQQGIANDCESVCVSPPTNVKKKVHDNVDKMLIQGDGIPLAVDENGYVPLPALPCAVVGPPRAPSGDESGDDLGSVFCSTLSVEVTYSENLVMQSALQKVGSGEKGEDITCRSKCEGGNDTVSEAGVPNEDRPAQRLNIHMVRSPHYCEIPDELVSPLTKSLTRHSQCQETDQGHGKGQDRDGSGFRERPPMPLPRRQASESSLDSGVQTSLDPEVPYRKNTSKDFKNTANDETRQTSGRSEDSEFKQRRPCSDMEPDVAANDTLRKLMQNMRTTMEWNEARKLLMSKSHTCTTEMAEEMLKGVVSDTYKKCARRLSSTSQKDNLAQKLRKYLLKKNKYDEDILTKEFLTKCIHLLRSS